MDRFQLFLILNITAFAYAADSQPAQVTRRMEVSASAATSGACSALLPDGRSFITGGRASAEPLSVARYFERNGTVSPAASMLAARTGHICIALADGSVLVAGGEAGKAEAANSAEIYHPDTNTWASTGGMQTARKGATAILLKNGMALVAGGEISGKPTNTLEIYDPVQGRFDPVPGVLPAARAGYALAVLEDGRVLIAGGLEGEQPLDSIDLFDPEMGRIYPAGRMLSPRARFTATRLASGKVLFAGGTGGSSELASAECTIRLPAPCPSPS